MGSRQTFCINQPGVISEVIEGEAIALNFESGTYYSFNDSCLALWEAIEQGVPADNLPSVLALRYPDAEADFATDVDRVLRELLDEQLIRAQERTPAEAIATVAGAETYQPPALQKFTDLQELLLLDPIHDIADTAHPLGGT